MLVFPKLIYQINALTHKKKIEKQIKNKCMPSQIKIQQTFLGHKIWQVDSKTYMEKQKGKKAKTILKEKNKVV